MVSGWVAVAAAVNLAIFLLQFDFNSCASSSLFPAVGTVNGSVTLSPLNTLPFTEIIWKKGKNKVIEWDSDGVRSYPPFDARIQLNNVSGDLHISYLTSWDEGEYEVEMHPSKSMKYYLTVFDPLPSPILQCQLVNESIEVQCQVPESYSRHRGQLNYSWHCRLPQCDENTTPVLRLNQNDNLSEQVHCSVANPESRKASSADLSTCVPHYNSRNRDLLILSLTIAVCMCMFVMSSHSPPEILGQPRKQPIYPGELVTRQATFSQVPEDVDQMRTDVLATPSVSRLLEMWQKNRSNRLQLTAPRRRDQILDH